jgi:hypothetical protein
VNTLSARHPVISTPSQRPPSSRLEPKAKRRDLLKNRFLHSAMLRITPVEMTEGPTRDVASDSTNRAAISNFTGKKKPIRV